MSELRGNQKEEVIKDILMLVAGGLILSAAIVAPGSTELLKLFRKKYPKSISEHELQDVLHAMKRERLVSWSETKDEVTLQLTTKGKKRSIRYKVDDLKLKQPPKWDHLWRIVIFDIPEIERSSRDIFRSKLKLLGFKQFQKSMWVTPLPCKEEVVFLVNLLGIDRYVIFIETRSLQTSQSSHYPHN